jgi:hypothetical protein
MQNGTLILYDLLGNIVLKNEINKKEIIINRGNLAAGTYIYILTGSTGIVARGKIIAE